MNVDIFDNIIRINLKKQNKNKLRKGKRREKKEFLHRNTVSKKIHFYFSFCFINNPERPGNLSDVIKLVTFILPKRFQKCVSMKCRQKNYS